MEKKIEHVCPNCGKDLAVAGAIEIREVEHHAYSGQVTFHDDGKPYIEGDIATDSCDDVDGRYAMCSHCLNTLWDLDIYL